MVLKTLKLEIETFIPFSFFFSNLYVQCSWSQWNQRNLTKEDVKNLMRLIGCCRCRCRSWGVQIKFKPYIFLPVTWLIYTQSAWKVTVSAFCTQKQMIVGLTTHHTLLIAQKNSPPTRQQQAPTQCRALYSWNN